MREGFKTIKSNPPPLSITLTSLVASRTSTTSSGVGAGLSGGCLRLDVALGAAHCGLVNRLHRARRRFISFDIVTYVG